MRVTERNKDTEVSKEQTLGSLDAAKDAAWVALAAKVCASDAAWDAYAAARKAVNAARKVAYAASRAAARKEQAEP